MNSHELLQEGLAMMAQRPDLATEQNIVNLRIAARLKWEQEEMGGLEYVQFAYRNGAPIVSPGHCGHPKELLKRGFIDGIGWPDAPEKTKIKLHKWPDGNHWYAYVGDVQVIDCGNEKWNSAQEAEEAARGYLNRIKSTPLAGH